jgi:hypothetical protein
MRSPEKEPNGQIGKQCCINGNSKDQSGRQSSALEVTQRGVGPQPGRNAVRHSTGDAMVAKAARVRGGRGQVCKSRVTDGPEWRQENRTVDD